MLWDLLYGWGGPLLAGFVFLLVLLLVADCWLQWRAMAARPTLLHANRPARMRVTCECMVPKSVSMSSSRPVTPDVDCGSAWSVDDAGSAQGETLTGDCEGCPSPTSGCDGTCPARQEALLRG